MIVVEDPSRYAYWERLLGEVKHQTETLKLVFDKISPHINERISEHENIDDVFTIVESPKRGIQVLRSAD